MAIGPPQLLGLIEDFPHEVTSVKHSSSLSNVLPTKKKNVLPTELYLEGIEFVEWILGKLIL